MCFQSSFFFFYFWFPFLVVNRWATGCCLCVVVCLPPYLSVLSDALALSFVSEENQVRQLKILLTSGGFVPDDRNGAPTFATLERLVSAFKVCR